MGNTSSKAKAESEAAAGAAIVAVAAAVAATVAAVVAAGGALAAVATEEGCHRAAMAAAAAEEGCRRAAEAAAVAEGRCQSEAAAAAVAEERCQKAAVAAAAAVTVERCQSEATRKAEVDCKLPHNCEAIIKDSDSLVDISSKDKLYEQLHAGVFLNRRRKKYWMDERGNNCFMLFANDLLMNSADTGRYWQWVDLPTSDGLTSVAELVNVCRLGVHGRFNTANLSPNVRYEVAYLIMLDKNAFGWEVPINLRITFGNGSKQERRENLKEKPRRQWIQIPVGEVEGHGGEIGFSMFEHDGGRGRSGLIIKGVVIHPRK